MKSPARLTDIVIRNLKPGQTRREIPDPGARGLYVIVHPSGRKSFCVRYRHADLPRKLTLQGGISLAAARKLCADALHEVAQGHDPSAAKKAQNEKTAAAAVNTLQYVCEEYFRREHGKLRTAAAREATLRRLVFPTLGRRQIDSIKRSEIIRLLDRIEDNSGARSADLALQYIRKIMTWHAVRDDEFRSPIVRGMGGRYNTVANARSRVLTDDEVRKIWAASADDGPFPAVIRFLLLTGARRGEAAGLRWDEIEGTDWLLPASRNKTQVDLLRPLSKAAMVIVEAQPRLGDFVFSVNGNRPISYGRAKRSFIDTSGVSNWRLHDLRRTSRTLLSRAGISPDVAERCLGHVIPGVRGTYDRHSFYKEKVHAFEALAALLERIVHPPEGDVVTPLRRGGAKLMGRLGSDLEGVVALWFAQNFGDFSRLAERVRKGRTLLPDKFSFF